MNKNPDGTNKEGLSECQFVHIPETCLPGGRIVRAFKVGQYLSSQDEDGRLVISREAVPRTEIGYNEAVNVSNSAGCQLISETQWLAIAFHIACQDKNWTGGAVGRGKLFQGYRLHHSGRVHAGKYVPKKPSERRWFALPDDQQIWDFAGMAYSWVSDDVQGNEKGTIAKGFKRDSPSLVIPYPDQEKGQGGWLPEVSEVSNWKGFAIARGGCWNSNDAAGVFHLNVFWPSYKYNFIGFRSVA